MIGMYFNDATKIIQYSNYFIYLPKLNDLGEQTGNRYYFDKYPKELAKKVSIFQHFI